MKLAILALGSVLTLSAPAAAAPLPVGGSPDARPYVDFAQHTYNSRGFRRCMRAKYGPRYFARVPRAHRWHMSQACMA
jgi:hypothetical protein